MMSLSDGERKRIAFVNVLLKLKREDVKFLVLDEPFKGVDMATQQVMVELIRENLPKNCTVLFSNHEQNHGFNTDVVRLGEDKGFVVEAVG